MMRRFFLIYISMVSMALTIHGQKLLSCKVNTDTILLGNHLEIKYSAENIEVQFEAPDFTDLPLVYGPSVSTQMSIVNGKMSRSMSYTYTLKPYEIGIISIPPAYFMAKDTTYEVPPFQVIVLPNPDHDLQPGKANKPVFIWDATANGVIEKPQKKILAKKKKRL